ncbi:Formin-like protein 3, variant 2 [Lathyrus oleraceus]|uniref:Formin-like protein n=1 Tax=Pisum sativum TaxID=3888 RepID=A0A9D5ANU0_PEA|nr:Formin-like protein 3, variant 2 [Pisum sativum]
MLIQSGNQIPVELIQTVLKMAPTTDEELKLRLFTGDVSRLGSAERFLKALVDIPLAFKRLEALRFMFTLPEEASNIRECFTTLEVSCNKLRKSRVFQKLLEAVLKTGNRLNNGTYRGDAQAFKLDTLLKLADVKGTDGKTTLLHFVVHEIIRSEGLRAVRTEKSSQSHSSMKAEDFIGESNGASEEHYRYLGLQVVSGLSTELEDVKKAAVIDGDALTSTVLRLYNMLVKSEELLNTDLKNLEEDSEFHRTLANFVEKAREEVIWLIGEEKRITTGVKSTADYFQGNTGKEEGLRLFVIVRDFLVMLNKVCKEVQASTTKTVAAKGSPTSKKEAPSSSPDSNQRSLSDMHRILFPAISERRIHDSSSSSSSSSDDDDDEMLPT